MIYFGLSIHYKSHRNAKSFLKIILCIFVTLSYSGYTEFSHNPELYVCDVSRFISSVYNVIMRYGSY